MERRLLPLGPMARRLGVESKWLRAEAAKGAIPHVPAGKTLLFDSSVVEKILLERAAGAHLEAYNAD